VAQDEDLSVRVGLTEAQYRRALARIESSTQRTAKKAEDRFRKANRTMARGFDRSSRSASSFANGGLRNVSMQLSQVAQQGAASGDYLRALSMQLPDLALGFGTVGIAIGAAGAVLGPFVADLVRGGEEARDLDDVVGDLSDTVDSYAAAAEQARRPTSDLREEYGELADEAERLFKAQLQLERLELASTITEAQAALRDMFGSVADVPEEYARAYATAVREIEELDRPRLNAQGIDIRSDAELRAANERIAALRNIVDRVRPAIAQIKEQLDVTDEAAGDLLATLVRFSEASSLDEQYAALERFQGLYLSAVESAGGLTDETRETANAIDAALEALFNLRQVQEETGDAAATTADEIAAATLAALDLEPAITRAAGALGQASSSAAALARELGVSLETAQRLASFGPQGITRPQGGRGGDPRDMGGSFLDWQTRDATEFLENWRPPSPSRSGGRRGSSRPAVDPLKSGRETAEQLRQEIQLLGQSAQRVAELRTKWAALAAAKRAGIPITEDLRSKIEAQAAEVGRLTVELENGRAAQERFDQAMDDIAAGLADALLEAENWREGMADVLRGLARDILQSGIRQALDHVFGGVTVAGSENTGGGGFLGSLLSWITGRATGGRVRAGQPYEVGEHGRELFVPGQSGTIVSAAQTQRLMSSPAAGASVTLNYAPAGYGGSVRWAGAGGSAQGAELQAEPELGAQPMSLTFPRDMTSDQCWDEHSFRLVHRQEFSRTAGGETQGKDLGPPLWAATFESYPLMQAEAEALEADLQTLGGVVRSFHVTPRRKEPSSRDGETLTGVAVASVGANNDAVSLDGLPPGFVMTAGDYIAIETAAGGRELYRLARGGSADATGVTPDLAVAPHIRPVVNAGDVVTLAPPVAEMRLQPESLQSRRVTRYRWRVSFQAIQVIR